MNHAYRTDVSGTLVYRVLSPIQAIENTTSTIIAYIETWAGDDFTVARYNPSKGGIVYGGIGVPKSSGGDVINGYSATNEEGCIALTPNYVSPNPLIAQGPIGLAKHESVNDVVNDGPISISQSLAAINPIPSGVTKGIQTVTVGADHDFYVSCWTVPRISQNYIVPAAMPEVTPLEKVRTLFYGIHSDCFINTNPTGFTVRYGIDPNAKKVTFPYASNAQYLGIGSVIDVNSAGTAYVTPFGDIYATIASLPNAKVFHPWTLPVINAVSAPRTAGRAHVTMPPENRPMRKTLS